ncbi:hypothetical protein NCTC2275_04078 [Mycobacterium marinum]|nr:hypothetical protein NCTC2275_04078 [Mycobacterium marinum]
MRANSVAVDVNRSDAATTYDTAVLLGMKTVVDLRANATFKFR